MANSWQVGALYPPGGLNNIAWTQPGGIGTQVFPAQIVGGSYESTEPFNERSGIFNCGCGHSQNQALIQREFDYDTNQSVALVCCPLCGFVSYTLTPFEAVLDTVYQPITVV